MHSKPVIFISAVSGELKGARQLVANTLTFLGYEPDWQDIFGAEQGDLRGMLRRRIDAADGVVQLVGKCFGFEPHAADGISPLPDATFGRVSYTQYEALYAKKRGKPVWYFFLDEDFPADPHNPEADDIRHLQDAYRERVRAAADLHQSARTPDTLQLRVHELRNELAQLRRTAKRHASLVLVLLLLLAAGTAWVLQSQRHSARTADNTHRAVVSLETEVTKLREGVNALPGIQAQALQQQPGQKLGQVEDHTYEMLATQLGIEEKRLRVELPALARQLQAATDTPPLERANAAYVTKDYAQAETFALRAAHAALGAASPRMAEAIQAYELAGQAAQQRIDYKDALRQLRKAEQLTDRQRDGKEWARVQFALARVLDNDGDYRAAGTIFQDVVKEQTSTLGPNDPVTLLSRLWFGIATAQQGRNDEAEQELRAIIELETRVQGVEHADCLKARNGWANVLCIQGKYIEAENEYRAVLAIRERVLGPEHPDTLLSRGNLAITLHHKGKDAEAEAEHRAVLAIGQRVLGTDHPNTLLSRNLLAGALCAQGKYTEAEQESRESLAIMQRVLGSEHPDTLRSRYGLAASLYGQHKDAEAEQQFRLVRAISERVLGSEHPDALSSRNALAVALNAQGKHAEAEREIRALVPLYERVLGREHPDTLLSRGNLANALGAQGKYAEAEAEYRAGITASERVLGREHPSISRWYHNFALALEGQKNYREALVLIRRAEEGWLKVLGSEHPDTQNAKAARERIEDELKRTKGSKR